MKNLDKDKYFVDFIKTRAIGVATPALELIRENRADSNDIFILYKDCVRQATKLLNAVGGCGYDPHNALDKVNPDEFARIIKWCYEVLLQFLYKETDSPMKDRKEIVIQWCSEFRYCFEKFEEGVKSICLQQLPFYQKELDFDKGILVRSVDGLGIERGA